ncbi:FtsL-like putative cell division protein [Reichenbachiella agarivorans]|uniref:FtsL-like putative cell division protein n=1 Tax=Reichenbachiella agarivorans TaxID=2979464 RepID=A0ABY6CJP5_9BACT|nr:FtsL-like putative cell division protein [Reichenbachiella agarivorans]UXP30738.1 FtsL-like putative cell division protein [Reichenbachiella agarivorans]
MASNTYRNPDTTRSTGKRSFFSLLESFINVEKLFENGLPIQFLMPILYVTVLCIIYIGNLHFAEKSIRKISKLRVEVEDLRADYTTLKADYMFTSKQSEVAKKAKKLGLYESIDPPYKIILHSDE